MKLTKKKIVFFLILIVIVYIVLEATGVVPKNTYLYLWGYSIMIMGDAYAEILLVGNDMNDIFGNCGHCFSGTLTGVHDGDTIYIDNELYDLALVNAVEYGDVQFADSIVLLNSTCGIGDIVQVDRDGRSDNVQVTCNGTVLNQVMIDSGLAIPRTSLCGSSDFAGKDWFVGYCRDPIDYKFEKTRNTHDMPLYNANTIYQDVIYDLYFEYKGKYLRTTDDLASTYVKELYSTGSVNVGGCHDIMIYTSPYQYRVNDNLIEYYWDTEQEIIRDIIDVIKSPEIQKEFVQYKSFGTGTVVNFHDNKVITMLLLC